MLLERRAFFIVWINLFLIFRIYCTWAQFKLLGRGPAKSFSCPPTSLEKFFRQKFRSAKLLPESLFPHWVYISNFRCSRFTVL
ncbi:hypothetical protein BGP_0336 [Beggiatoa sp. PS]|nr:hypothetical protein BGP_0336 [Beggiatoa sp. PS]